MTSSLLQQSSSSLFTFSCSAAIPSMRECVISITGFTADTVPTREQVKCVIDTIGACYMGPLCKDYTTHLVCEGCTRYVMDRV